MKKWIVGIDEVGRGPLAGPVAVCALCFPVDFKQANFRHFKDSKKLSEKQREIWLQKIKQCMEIKFRVCFQSEKIIDGKGISFAIRKSLATALKALKLKPEECAVLLDGGLKAPIEYINQKTIIKGDEKKLAIALASIAAKVARDNLMKRLAKKYPSYDFEIHKGYGTKRHSEKIVKHGLCAIHRRGFCKRYVRQ